MDMDALCLLRTLRKTSEDIPDFEELLETYGWLGGEDQSDLAKETEDLYRAYRKTLNRWLHGTSEEEILEVRDRLDSETIKVFRKLVRTEYKNFWQPSNQGMPNSLLAPSPFRLVNRQQSKLISVTVLKYGKTTLTMSGPVLHAEDSKVLVAVIQLKNRTKLRMARIDGSDHITAVVLHLKDGLAELAKEMNKNHPWNQSTQEAIWNSLDRLVGCKFALDAPKRKTIGHFLNRIDDIRDCSEELVLQFDREFLALYEGGFQQIKQLDAYYQLSPKGVLLHNYVTRQREFNTKGILNAISIRKLCDISGLSDPNSKPENYILVKRVREAAEELYERGLIGKYLVTDKKFVILGNKHKN